MTVAYVATYNGEALLVEFGNADGPPETFTVKAMINADRGVDGKASAKTTIVPRTDDPTKPSKTARVIDAVDFQITGAGLINATDEIYFLNWLLAGGSKNIKFGTINMTGANGGYSGTGAFVLTSYKTTGKVKEGVTCQITLDQADLVAITANT